ncbi:DUF3043 domain-containing protein [Thalassiella azotivora]
MLGRKKTPTPQAPAPRQVAPRPGAKNRPTPKRHERVAQRRRPLVPDDRKAAAKQAREHARAERMRAREAMLSGDEKHLPPRDKGPHKRFVRDYVDARWSVGEFFLLIALVVVLLTFAPSPLLRLVATLALWATVLMSLLDGWLLARQLRKALLARFGEEGLQGGTVRYGVLRAFQIRRTRLPKPMVARGEYPS